MECPHGSSFEQVLRQDHEFWWRCEQRWGQGQGYRAAIRDMTDNQFESNYDAALELVVNLMSEEWGNIIKQLEDMLKETGDPALNEVE